MITFFIIFFLFVLLVAIPLFIVYNDKAYCYVFRHKDWKLYEYFIRNYDRFEYEYSIGDVHCFMIPDTNITAHIWSDNTFSIHRGTRTLLTSFDKYHSDKMKELLSKKIKH